jgi:outer membrane biosynthesis protein TonB
MPALGPGRARDSERAPGLRWDSESEPERNPESESESEQNPEPESDPEQNSEPESESDSEAESEPDPEPAPNPESQSEPESEPELEPESRSEREPNSELKVSPQVDSPRVACRGSTVLACLVRRLERREAVAARRALLPAAARFARAQQTRCTTVRPANSLRNVFSLRFIRRREAPGFPDRGRAKRAGDSFLGQRGGLGRSARRGRG